MNRELRIAVAGFVLLVPALILVSTGVLELETPDGFDALMHPALLMGGLLVAAITAYLFVENFQPRVLG